MRILTTKKIWRAFPELDQFDDETCARYIHRIWELQSAWKFWIIHFTILPISLIGWLAIMIATSEIFDLSVFPEMSEVLTLMLVGFVGMPLIVIIFVRDYWLRRQIRRQLGFVACKDCEYNLIGLEIQQSGECEYVLCPECGVQNTLDNVTLSREDIDPSFLTESSSGI